MDPATAVKSNLHSIFLVWYQSVTEWNQMQRNGMFKAELDRVSQWLMEADISDTHGKPVQCNVLWYPTSLHFHWASPKKYGKPRLGESTLT